jgi:hypothetical protein
VGVVVNQVQLEQVFSKLLDYSLRNIQPTFDTHNLSLSRDSSIGQIVAKVPSGFSLTSIQKTKK